MNLPGYAEISVLPTYEELFQPYAVDMTDVTPDNQLKEKFLTKYIFASKRTIVSVKENVCIFWKNIMRHANAANVVLATYGGQISFYTFCNVVVLSLPFLLVIVKMILIMWTYIVQMTCGFQREY